ncbi:MAG: hypothetical protein ABJC19_09570 [Gemmatimonadota bacterium]
MSPLDELLASYLDLTRHLDPLRHPFDAPEATQHRLGRFDAPWLMAQVAALKSIANAIEDLEEVESLDDEVDRTMLLNTIRTDIVDLETLAGGDSFDGRRPLEHARHALYALMDEEFDADSEAALRDRIAALPDFLASLRDETRRLPADVAEVTRDAASLLLEALDEASEYLEDAAVQPALVAVAEHRAWLDDPDRLGGTSYLGEEAVERHLATLSSEPVGVKGTLRLLELRRVGVERSLLSAAEELGSDNALQLVRTLIAEEPLDFESLLEEWPAEWERVREELATLGMPVTDDPPVEDPFEAEDRWSLAVAAVREQAALTLDTARDMQSRAVRRLLLAPGLMDGWGRTVAALLRATPVTDQAERRLMLSYLALLDAVAAESDLLLQSRRAGLEELNERTMRLTGVSAEAARSLMRQVVDEPLAALAAALAHEAWQSWYAEEGGDPVIFLQRALAGGGLSVPLARWALTN